jgi:hypothetical protein
MPCRVQIGYEFGYARLGIGEAYTLRMLAQEFWALTRNDTISHKTTDNPKSFHDALTVDVVDVPPVKIQEDAGRGTSINAAADQASLLPYWAWARQSIAVGVSLPIDNHTVEYWLNFVLDPLPDDDDGRVYAEVLR